MDNLQKQNVELKELLKKLKHEGVGWLKLLKEKEVEKEKLKIDLIDLALEQKNREKDSKILEEAREANHDLKTQLEEAKRTEEILKRQLEEKEETVHKLEMEVVGLRKKGKKNEALVKLQDSSIVLDKILDCQRSPLDKTGISYKKNKEKSEDDTWSPKTPVAGPSTSKREHLLSAFLFCTWV